MVGGLSSYRTQVEGVLPSYLASPLLLAPYTRIVKKALSNCARRGNQQLESANLELQYNLMIIATENTF